MKRLSKTVLEFLVCILPLCLVFSYYPVISFGVGETMNFELSVPLIWLAVFDVMGVVAMVVERKSVVALMRRWWKWALFPAFVTLSLAWSANLVRGVLTVGVMWLVAVAVMVIAVFREWFAGEEFRRKWWKWFFGSALFVCAWCVVQCVLDVVGVSREYSLMCVGCTSWSFGFPHPNGFAVEPQFMGNLLLAPAIASMWCLLFRRSIESHPLKMALLFFVFVATLFLVFSRGAIYAFIVGMMFMSGFLVVRERRRVAVALKRLAVVWGVTVVAFLFTLNMQGIMAQVGPTNDTYGSGVAKVLNQLSLGIIDIRGNSGDANTNDKMVEVDVVVVEKPVKNFEMGEANSEAKTGKTEATSGGQEAVFDGYVEESTEIRKMMTRNALKMWSSDVRTVMMGVGIGGAGQAMYDAGLTDWPKEIVQNEYANTLLEFGVVGIVLVIILVIMAVRVVSKSSANAGVVLTLVVAYGVSLLFFSGFANALQIYLLPVVFWAMGGRRGLQG